MGDIGPERGISFERPRGAEGAQGAHRRAAAQRAPAGVSLRGSARPRGRGPRKGGGEHQRGREPEGGAGVGGPGPADWSTAGETLPHAAGSDWPSRRKG